MHMFIELAIQKDTCKTIEDSTGIVCDEVDLMEIVRILREDGLIPTSD